MVYSFLISFLEVKLIFYLFDRVSFGSSKGSMVETLIYETPVQEEPEPSRLDEDKTDETDLFSG